MPSQRGPVLTDVTPPTPLLQGGPDTQANGGGGERTHAFRDELGERPPEDRPPLHHLRRLLPGLQHPRREGVWSRHLRLQVSPPSPSHRPRPRCKPSSFQAGSRRPGGAEWNKDGRPDPGGQRRELRGHQPQQRRGGAEEPHARDADHQGERNRLKPSLIVNQATLQKPPKPYYTYESRLR